ncbi:hypothetical protein [Metaclostridioides mangenotii]|uniref:hypothetical protein n=1 Tax=Metaclostridioides mangenotii TaxID=1540 RepID=UPI0012679C47|nr:hypothetical protein [Clostridioides mangenotii]
MLPFKALASSLMIVAASYLSDPPNLLTLLTQSLARGINYTISWTTSVKVPGTLHGSGIITVY